MIQKCGFLIEKNGDYFYPHFSFQEYFSALELFKRFLAEKNSSQVYQSENSIQNLIGKKTFEGCLADLSIKPKTQSKDLWLNIQVKSNAKRLRTYS